jgi:hypothetical protein
MRELSRDELEWVAGGEHEWTGDPTRKPDDSEWAGATPVSQPFSQPF